MARSKSRGRARKQKKRDAGLMAADGGTASGSGETGSGAAENRGGWDKDSRRSYAQIVMENKNFEKFYKAQNMVPADEWGAFMEALRTPLPVTFRVTGFRSQAESLLDLIKSKFFSELADVELDGVRQEPPECLNWYPGGLAWQINSPRTAIRKFPALKKLHEFLISETECGNISRQEAVSMIPPLFMDIKPHHKILDMCAAPGSKTAQLIEYLHQDENINIPEGYVVANDVDNKRCYLMVHQVKRLQSPCFMIVNHDVQQLPNFRCGPDPKDFVRFDRILADVPCSGDGTLRKNKDVWIKWRPCNGAQLHKLQKNILRRGLELLKEGGRLVYSTCSFSPIENEAVIASMLATCGDSVELVESSLTVPGLKTMPGLWTWTITDNEGQVLEDYKSVPKIMKKCYLPSVFPPDNAADLHLERCMRVLPHHQNTGGFFIAVLTKKKHLPWQKPTDVVKLIVTPEDIENPPVDEEEGKSNMEGGDGDVDTANVDTANSDTANSKTANVDTANADTANLDTANSKTVNMDTANADAANVECGGDANGKDKPGEKRKREREEKKTSKKKRNFGHKEDPFLWFKEDEPLWPPIKQYYGVSDDFPMGQCLVRCDSGKKRQIYFASEAIKTLQSYNHEKVKVVNLGIVVLVRSDNPAVQCDYRLTQDAIHTFSPFLSRRFVKISMANIVTLLSEDAPFFFKFATDFANEMETYSQGSLILKYTPEDTPGAPKCNLTIVGWRGKTSLRSFVPRYERSHFLRLCGIEANEKDLRAEAEKGSSSAKAETTATDSQEEVPELDVTELIPPPVLEDVSD
ncbi:RNA cytosine-C(5)-methyltransferase NSUN2-like [Lineus longissimus]|uniref:RNA cytosine-C(5)-methyltransferase NSUN2-like n=1 Tax=Lineus longissimus TaxID=88925 RepID=UPI002B4EC230